MLIWFIADLGNQCLGFEDPARFFQKKKKKTSSLFPVNALHKAHKDCQSSELRDWVIECLVGSSLAVVYLLVPNQFVYLQFIV